MKITIISDLHIEFEPLHLPGGEVLIVSGDTVEARNAHNYRWFFDQLEKYEKVFMVLGNHEHYKGTFQKTAQLIRDQIPDNTTLLDNEAVFYRGIQFAGATLWTDMNGNDPLTKFTLMDRMNDFRVIKYKADTYSKFTPDKAYAEHKNTLKFFDSLDKIPTVIITHHAPSNKSVGPLYANEDKMNGGYRSELAMYDHVKLWTHGHMHNSSDYILENTRIVCNPKGYHNENKAFDVQKTVEIVL